METLAIGTISVGELAAVLSALFAAIATAAAWAGVRQSRRLQRDALRPYLNGQAVQGAPGAPIKFAVQNAGAGAARGVGFCVIVDDEYVSGYTAPNMGGFLKPGERNVVVTQFSGGGGGRASGVVTCHDVLDNLYAFNVEDGEVRIWKPDRWWRKARPGPEPEKVLAQLLPGRSLVGLRKVKGKGARSNG